MGEVDSSIPRKWILYFIGPMRQFINLFCRLECLYMIKGLSVPQNVSDLPVLMQHLALLNNKTGHYLATVLFTNSFHLIFFLLSFFQHAWLHFHTFYFLHFSSLHFSSLLFVCVPHISVTFRSCLVIITVPLLASSFTSFGLTAAQVSWPLNHGYQWSTMV